MGSLAVRIRKGVTRWAGSELGRWSVTEVAREKRKLRDLGRGVWGVIEGGCSEGDNSAECGFGAGLSRKMCKYRYQRCYQRLTEVRIRCDELRHDGALQVGRQFAPPAPHPNPLPEYGARERLLAAL